MHWRHEADYLANQLREYIGRTVAEGAEHMASNTKNHPELAERLRGYLDACEDIQLMLDEPGHQFYRGLARYIYAAREMDPMQPLPRTMP